MRAGRLKVDLEKVPISEAEAEELIKRIGGQVFKERQRNTRQHDDGIDSVELAVARGFGDLRTAPGYQEHSLTTGERARWQVDFTFHGRLFGLNILFHEGRISFRQGITTDAVIRHILVTLEEIKQG